MPYAPDIPTFIEQGVPDFECYTWHMALVPAGTPDPVVRAINAAFNRALAVPAVQERLRQMTMNVVTDSTPESAARFLASELVREKLFRLTGDELPYASTVVIEKWEEEGRLRRIAATIVVDREAHKAIVIGEGGERLKRIGSEARQDLERLLDAKVFLELWVKVRSGWADREDHLRSYGYE